MYIQRACTDQIINRTACRYGDKSEKAKATLKNSELLQRFKEIDVLPEEEQGILLKVISAYIRDYRAKQAYAS